MKLIIFILTTVISIATCSNDNFSKTNRAKSRPFTKEANLHSIKKDQSNDITSIPVKSETQDSIKLNTFTRLPKNIEGCVCYFYLSKKDETKRKYIMAEIFAQIAYVSINGKMERFNLVDFKDKVWYNYSNGIYKLRVEFNNKIERNIENFTIKGTLIIFKDQKRLIHKNIIGECSC